MTAREQAKEYLAYYFGLIATKAGLRWDSDNIAEVESIVENIIKAVKASLAEEGGDAK